MFDHAIDESWPELASANELARGERVLERNQYLAMILTQIARLEADDAEALSVADGRCSATLTGEQHVRLARATRELRKHEDDLYRVKATWTELTSADWTRFVGAPGVAQGESGAFRVGAGVATPLDDVRGRAPLHRHVIYVGARDAAGGNPPTARADDRSRHSRRAEKRGNASRP